MACKSAEVPLNNIHSLILRVFVDVPPQLRQIESYHLHVVFTFANVVGRMLCIRPCLSVCLFVCLSVCLSVCLFVC